MSLTSALNAASSGMTVSSRWAENVSSNIGNANTEGYARRGIGITAGPNGAPQVSTIGRAVDTTLDAMYRTEVSAGRSLSPE